jgi:hypothetical protein
VRTVLIQIQDVDIINLATRGYKPVFELIKLKEEQKSVKNYRVCILMVAKQAHQVILLREDGPVLR